MIFALLISIAFNILAAYMMFTAKNPEADTTELTYFVVAHVRVRVHSGWQERYFRGTWETKPITTLEQVYRLEEAIKKHIAKRVPTLLIPLSNKDDHSVQIVNIQRMPL